jgi:hypothetical protein
MPPDRTASLAAAAARKRDAALERTHHALRDLATRGEIITFQSVARAAAVSRQWLYQQPELRAEIERLREHRPSPPARAARERASESSLRQRVETLLDENRRLRKDNAALRDELALLYGERRQALTR